MAVVRGVREKVHLPIYDSLTVEAEKQLRDAEPTSTLKFFVDVQNKTKLETNLQSAGLLPHYNTFEARALRVVISDLPAQFPAEPTVSSDDIPVTDDQDKDLEVNNPAAPAVPTVKEIPIVGGVPTVDAGFFSVAAVVNLGLNDIIDFLQQAKDDPDRSVDIPADDDSVTLTLKDPAGNAGPPITPAQLNSIVQAGGKVTLFDSDLEDLLAADDIPDDERPLDEQVSNGNGAGTLVSKLIYNTVTTLYVGEKIMIQMPTWFFPSGAGAYSEGATLVTHGEPNPTATFRFAEPIYIDKQQNFRVEIDVPDKNVLDELQRIYGPMFIWVVLDGYMTRDVQ